MNKINLQQLKDYQVCARLYDYRHVDKLSEKIGGRELMIKNFENTLKSIVNFYFYKKQSGSAPSYASLLNRWEKHWYPKDTTAYDIIHEQHESFHKNNASYTSQAASALLSICENFSDPNIIPIAINEEYIVQATKEVSVADKFDLIYSLNKKTYVVKWVFNFQFKKEYLYTIDFALANMAYFNKYGRRIDNADFGYYDLLNPKSNFVKFESKKEDVDALVAWCHSLSDEKFFLPKRGLTAYCKSCPFDSPCSKWKLSSKEM